MANYYLGVDIGATKIAAALISGHKIIKKIKIPTQTKKNNTTILKNINSAIAQVYLPKVKGIGIGVAGQINQTKGVVVSSPNFSKNFKNINLQKSIQENFKRPVKVENDANCFTLGEAIYGAGKNYAYVIGLTLGTGIGGGIVINKKIYHGAGGLAGELGHVTIVQNGTRCSCGQKGHLEAYAAGRAMSKIHQQLTGQARHPLEIENQALTGNKKAQEVFKIMSQHLAEGLANIANIFDPDVIVIGGGLAKIKILIDPAIKLARKKVVYPQLAKVKIVPAKFNQSALLGPTLLFKK